MQIDIHVMELLASKLCHDLVSPVSAINNGVELIEDIGGSVVDEAMKLIGDSAAHASRRLRLFRVAYGRAGSEENLPMRDMRTIAEQYIAGGKVTLNWPEDQPAAVLAATRGLLKVALNTIILAEEVLAYGGAISLRPALQGNDIGCRFEIVGRNAQLAPQILAAFEGTAAVADLTPRSIQAYVTGKFAAHFNLKLVHDQSITDRLDITVYGVGHSPAA
jgi:histidine phosphotransferase ChpT